MGKVLFVLELSEPRLRKAHAPPSKRHKDAAKYSRKQKHKTRRDGAPDDSGASFLPGRQNPRRKPTKIQLFHDDNSRQNYFGAR